MPRTAYRTTLSTVRCSGELANAKPAITRLAIKMTQNVGVAQ
jgi:hypothetical protein